MDRNYTEKCCVKAISTLQHAGILIKKDIGDLWSAIKQGLKSSE
jgi:hypothetical protein